MKHEQERLRLTAAPSEERYAQAMSFLRTCYTEWGREAEGEARLAELTAEWQAGQAFDWTQAELVYGAKLAWRNNSRCIGRLFWDSLQVRDCRGLLTEDEVFAALLHHITHATNEGRIRPLITIFPEASSQTSFRIWNHQLIRYAGYELDGRIVGDPHSLAFTKQCEDLGWRGSRGDYDLLPIVIQRNNQPPKWFVLPHTLIKEVTITHPEFVWFADLGLKWYAVPIISDMALNIGGLRYMAAPFNGWYMVTEIAARNFADEGRYNKLPLIAQQMGLDTTTLTNFWKDRALVELTRAVYHSFGQAGVSIVDHHTASEQFMRFCSREQEQARSVNGRWSWLIPPMSPATSPIWEHPLEERACNPDFSYQAAPYGTTKKTGASACPFHPG